MKYIDEERGNVKFRYLNFHEIKFKILKVPQKVSLTYLKYSFKFKVYINDQRLERKRSVSKYILYMWQKYQLKLNIAEFLKKLLKSSNFCIIFYTSIVLTPIASVSFQGTVLKKQLVEFLFWNDFSVLRRVDGNPINNRNFWNLFYYFLF